MIAQNVFKGSEKYGLIDKKGGIHFYNIIDDTQFIYRTFKTCNLYIVII